MKDLTLTIVFSQKELQKEFGNYASTSMLEVNQSLKLQNGMLNLNLPIKHSVKMVKEC